MVTTAVWCHVLFRKKSSSNLGHLGRLVEVVPFPANMKQKIEQRGPWFLPHSLVPLVYPSSLQRPQQQHCLTAGRRHQRDAVAYAGHQPFMAAPLGFCFAVSKSLQTGCRECHNSKPQFLHEVPAHFDEHILSPSCNENCHHEAEHKTVPTSLHLSSDPASGNCGSQRGPR